MHPTVVGPSAEARMRQLTKDEWLAGIYFLLQWVSGSCHAKVIREQVNQVFGDKALAEPRLSIVSKLSRRGPGPSARCQQMYFLLLSPYLISTKPTPILSYYSPGKHWTSISG